MGFIYNSLINLTAWTFINILTVPHMIEISWAFGVLYYTKGIIVVGALWSLLARGCIPVGCGVGQYPRSGSSAVPSLFSRHLVPSTPQRNYFTNSVSFSILATASGHDKICTGPSHIGCGQLISSSIRTISSLVSFLLSPRLLIFARA